MPPLLTRGSALLHAGTYWGRRARVVSLCCDHGRRSHAVLLCVSSKKKPVEAPAAPPAPLLPCPAAPMAPMHPIKAIMAFLMLALAGLMKAIPAAAAAQTSFTLTSVANATLASSHITAFPPHGTTTMDLLPPRPSSAAVASCRPIPLPRTTPTCTKTANPSNMINARPPPPSPPPYIQWGTWVHRLALEFGAFGAYWCTYGRDTFFASAMLATAVHRLHVLYFWTIFILGGTAIATASASICATGIAYHTALIGAARMFRMKITVTPWSHTEYRWLRRSLGVARAAPATPDSDYGPTETTTPRESAKELRRRAAHRFMSSRTTATALLLVAAACFLPTARAEPDYNVPIILDATTVASLTAGLATAIAALRQAAPAPAPSRNPASTDLQTQLQAATVATNAVASELAALKSRYSRKLTVLTARIGTLEKALNNARRPALTPAKPKTNGARTLAPASARKASVNATRRNAAVQLPLPSKQTVHIAPPPVRPPTCATQCPLPRHHGHNTDICHRNGHAQVPASLACKVPGHNKHHTTAMCSSVPAYIKRKLEPRASTTTPATSAKQPGDVWPIPRRPGSGPQGLPPAPVVPQKNAAQVNFYGTDGVVTAPPDGFPDGALALAREMGLVVWRASGRNMDCLLSCVAMSYTGTYADKKVTREATAQLRLLVLHAANTIANFCRSTDGPTRSAILMHFGFEWHDLANIGMGLFAERELYINYKLLQLFMARHMELLPVWKTVGPGPASVQTPLTTISPYHIVHVGGHFDLLVNAAFAHKSDGPLPTPNSITADLHITLSNIATSVVLGRLERASASPGEPISLLESTPPSPPSPPVGFVSPTSPHTATAGPTTAAAPAPSDTSRTLFDGNTADRPHSDGAPMAQSNAPTTPPPPPSTAPPAAENTAPAATHNKQPAAGTAEESRPISPGAPPPTVTAPPAAAPAPTSANMTEPTTDALPRPVSASVGPTVTRGRSASAAAVNRVPSTEPSRPTRVRTPSARHSAGGGSSA